MAMQVVLTLGQGSPFSVFLVLGRAQNEGWEAPASIIAVGLTWREAILCNCLGMIIVAIPLIFNGAIGANLHLPYPVAARSGFGFNFAKFAVVVRFVTALFWHSIQTFSGSFALTNCISAIWPSYLNIPNHIPESVGCIAWVGMLFNLVLFS